jgi:HAD superfamily phosphatase (TIGR01668 family)
VPKQVVETVGEIDLEQLYAQGFRGIVTDLDNTLVRQKTPDATEACKAFIAQARAIGYRIVILSNNGPRRVGHFAKPLDLPFICRARKPRPGAFRAALQLLGVEPSQALMLGDQTMTDILGGNRAGLHTVLVRPVARHEEGLPTKINRVMERIVIRLLAISGYKHPWL